MVDTENIHKISQMGNSNTLTVITDGADFPHTGLIKALNQMSSGNIVVKTGADFDINQTGGNIVVDAGKILRNGMYHSVSSKTFADSDLITTHDKGYHLLVVADGREGGETVNNLYLRTPTAPNVVADFKLGDTIVAMIEYASTTSAGSRLIQFFTTNKEENGLSIAYANSNVYTEVGTLTGDANGITMTGLHKLDTLPTATADGSNSKVIIQDGNNDNTIRTITAQSIANLAPQGDITGITAGTGLTGTDLTGPVPTLNVEGLTVNELAAGSLLLSTESFADSDTQLMTAKAINDRIESFGYTTNVGDITGVDLSEGAGIDIASETNTVSGNYSATINLVLTEIIDNDGANRVLTSDGDGTLTAEGMLTVNGAVISIGGSLARSVAGDTTVNVDVMHSVVNAASTGRIMTLPTAGGLSSRVFRIKNMDNAAMTINTFNLSEVFESNLSSTDSRYVNPTQLVLQPRQTVLLQAVDDGIAVPNIDGGLQLGWLIVDNDTNFSGAIDAAGAITAVEGEATLALSGSVTVATGQTFVSPRLPVVSLNTSTTLTEATHAGRYIFVTGSSTVITIPDNQGAGVHFTIINNDGNGFTLRTGTSSVNGDNMNGAQTDIAVAARNGVTCISTGSDYVVLGV